MLDVSIVFLQTSKITQRDEYVLLSPFPDTFPQNFPIQRPSNTYIYIYTIHVHIYIYTNTYIYPFVSFTCWWTFRLRDQKDFARLLEGMLGGFHHGAPAKAEWSGLSKGCLSYARISEARGISLVLENADALRERGEERRRRGGAGKDVERGKARGEVPLGWNTIYINQEQDPLPFGKSHTFHRILFPIEYFHWIEFFHRPNCRFFSSCARNTRGIWRNSSNFHLLLRELSLESSL